MKCEQGTPKKYTANEKERIAMQRGANRKENENVQPTKLLHGALTFLLSGTGT
jgi:hypothetical protein